MNQTRPSPYAPSLLSDAERGRVDRMRAARRTLELVGPDCDGELTLEPLPPGVPIRSRVDPIAPAAAVPPQQHVTLDGEALEPVGGWECGFRYLLLGYCPYCRQPIENISVTRIPRMVAELTWCCADGCNP